MDESRSSDTSETFDDTPGAGGVSSQNHEEGSAPAAGESGGGRSEVSQDDSRQSGGEGSGRSDSDGDPGRKGGAGEGSQATGSPSGAG